MARKNYARRYAQAIFEIAQSSGELDRWDRDLERVSVLAGETEARMFLENPRVNAADRIALLERVLAGVNPLAINLVRLLAERDILHLAGNIAREYKALLNARRGIEQVKVTTALALDAPQTQALERRISELTGKNVQASFEVDAGIVGGFVARIDGKLLDGSTRTRLATLKKTMAGSGE